MNIDHALYKDYLELSNEWPLDDWSITKECFDKIVEILPFGRTILEIGSGRATDLLSRFYVMISIESNPSWLNRYKSTYIHIPIVEIEDDTFGKTKWLSPSSVKKQLHGAHYDLLLIDSGGDRVGIYDNMNLFDTNVPIIFDDTMAPWYLECATLVAKKYGYQITTFQCKRNKHCVHWWDGKRYSLLEKKEV